MTRGSSTGVALDTLNMALQWCKNRYPILEANVYIEMGNVLGEMREFEDSIKYHQKAITKLELTGNKTLQRGRILNNIGLTGYSWNWL